MSTPTMKEEIQDLSSKIAALQLKIAEHKLQAERDAQELDSLERKLNGALQFQPKISDVAHFLLDAAMLYYPDNPDKKYTLPCDGGTMLDEHSFMLEKYVEDSDGNTAGKILYTITISGEYVSYDD